MKKIPCPECRSKGEDTSGDNLCQFDDGSQHCFACGHHVHGSGTVVETAKNTTFKPVTGKVTALNHRRISEKTCRTYDYRRARKSDGTVVEVANYYRDGQLQAQHIRYPDKKFPWMGDTKKLPLFGQWLWRGKGRRIVVTEGEIDAMSIAEIDHCRWPVVSVPNGAEGAPQAIRDNYEFLSQYEEIVLAFDMDEPGQKAALACAEILPPGRVKIVSFPGGRKDANDMLRQGEFKALTQALWEARTFQPDGIVHVSDVSDEAEGDQEIWLFPWDCLNTSLLGQRSKEMTMWTSASGSGKSTISRELAHHHLTEGRSVGMVMLEESPAETLDDLIALRLSKPVRQIRAARKLNALLRAKGRPPIQPEFMDTLTDEEYDSARSWLREQKLYIYDHKGAAQYENLVKKLEYMAAALGVDVIILDHITAAIAGTDYSGSERESIDSMMKELRSLVERTGVRLDIVSQLKRANGTPIEEGGQISMSLLRGSGSLGTVPNNVLAVERNQQDEDPEMRTVMKVRVLKGRFTGKTGIAGLLRFNTQTRRLEEFAGKADTHVFDEEQPEPDSAGLDD